MSVLVSSVPLVVARIKTLMIADLATANYEGKQVLVTVGMKIGSQPFDQFILGDVTEGLIRYQNMRAGRKPRQEDYLLDIHIITRRPGEEADVAQTAAFSHYESLTDQMADDPSIGIAAIPTLVMQPREFKVSNQQDDVTRGWSCHLKCKLGISCRLD